jgi:hypothetical protein
VEAALTAGKTQEEVDAWTTANAGESKTAKVAPAAEAMKLQQQQTILQRRRLSLSYYCVQVPWWYLLILKVYLLRLLPCTVSIGKTVPIES